MMPWGMKAAPDEVLKINSCGCSGTTFKYKKQFLEKIFPIKYLQF